jgi:hypothetical protein
MELGRRSSSSRARKGAARAFGMHSAGLLTHYLFLN